MIYNQGKLNNFGTNGAPYFYAFCKSMSISEVVYFSSQYFFCSIMWMWSSYLRCSTTSMDPVDSVAEFSLTHYIQDDDLISLQVEPHRSVHYVQCDM